MVFRLYYDSNYHSICSCVARLLRIHSPYLIITLSHYITFIGLAEDGKTFFGNLMQNKEIGEKDKAGIIIDMMLAGVDTTGSTVGFMLYNLAKNPEVKSKTGRAFLEPIEY